MSIFIFSDSIDADKLKYFTLKLLSRPIEELANTKMEFDLKALIYKVKRNS